jgi:hypothetical protein
MPSSRHIPPEFTKGERLTADDMNKMSDIIRALASVGDAQDVIAIGGGTFRRQKRVTPQVRDAVLTSDMDAAGDGAPEDDKSDFTFKFLYPDKDDPDLLVEGNEEQDGVNRNAGLSGSTGDYIAVAKMGVEWRPISGKSCTSLIVRPRSDVDTGEAMVCDVHEGPILLETETGETIIALNTGSLIAADTRCEAVHYSCRKGGEPHLLSGNEVSSFLSSAALSDGVSSTTGDQYADYELFSLEC